MNRTALSSLCSTTARSPDRSADRVSLCESQALGRLSERESYDRAFRHRTAHMCAIAHEELPKAQWVKPTEVRCSLSSLSD